MDGNRPVTSGEFMAFEEVCQKDRGGQEIQGRAAEKTAKK
jgi:hypothetical protein